ncbi:GNAT family N-acetyltransferase [Streptomyces sp. NPDC021093]|uniref:GNAT family N-acetyltransferase n=1 Tax=Streptomyces sp. NPDC021093 TaxID=3365112 RepID=UPI0037B27FF5
MPATLRPLDAEHFPAWLSRSRADYAQELVALGQTSEDAYRQADETMAHSFPSGAPTQDHAVFDVVDDAGAAVGHLWIGPDRSDDADAWWVRDIAIDADKRGRGPGRRAMLLGLLGEEYARARGAHTLGLSVAGFNTGARGLDESLGYETTSVKMRKKRD